MKIKHKSFIVTFTLVFLTTILSTIVISFVVRKQNDSVAWLRIDTALQHVREDMEFHKHLLLEEIKNFTARNEVVDYVAFLNQNQGELYLFDLLREVGAGLVNELKNFAEITGHEKVSVYDSSQKLLASYEIEGGYVALSVYQYDASGVPVVFKRLPREGLPGEMGWDRSELSVWPTVDYLTPSPSAQVAAEADSLWLESSGPVLSHDAAGKQTSILGYVVTGKAISNSYAERLSNNTGTAVEFYAGKRRIGGLLPEFQKLPFSILSQLPMGEIAHRQVFLDDAYYVGFYPFACAHSPTVATIAAGISRASTTERTREAIASLVLIGSFCVVLVLPMVFFFSNRLIRPIVQLTKGAQRLGAGELDFRIPVAGTDEIGDLAGAFNQMAERLEMIYDHLEQMVAERTQELSQRNQDLKKEIEEHAHVENALKQSEEKYRAVINQSSDAIYLMEPKTRQVVEANTALLRLLGYDLEEILGMSVYRFVAHDPEDIEQKMRHAVSHKNAYLGERNYLTKDGAVVQVEVRTNPVTYAGKHFVCVVCRDVTERKKMEEELLKNRKLDSLGILAGGIAHDFNNILAAILGNVSLAKQTTGPASKAFQRLEEAEKAAIRAKDLTYQLLTFSKGGAPVKKAASIAGVIRESCDFSLRGSNVGCRFVSPDDSSQEKLWPVEIDTGQMSQVINNMIINAKQAMPEGGTVQVSMENTVLEDSADLPLQPGKYVRISIQDHGTGIPSELLPRIFDPYFTTKDSGSGLGLATSYSIVSKHDGYIGVESQVGNGTTFLIYLPASDEEPVEEAEVYMEPVAGKGKVLIVDDEEMIREVLDEMLSLLGYSVEMAADGGEAIDLYARSKDAGEPFDIIIMDLTIPGGLGGKETIRSLLQLDPFVKVIASSGYSNDPLMSNFKQHGFCGAVAKPYNLEQLSSVIHNALYGKGDNS